MPGQAKTNQRCSLWALLHGDLPGGSQLSRLRGPGQWANHLPHLSFEVRLIERLAREGVLRHLTD